MGKKIIKEIVPIDEMTTCGTLAYGYSNKKEAIKAIEKQIGGKIDDIKYMQKLRVIKFKKDGEDYYNWGKTCECCGRKNKGVLSWADID